VIQGGAADAMKKAVVDLYEADWHGGTIPLLTVHDELDFELPEDEARIIVPKIRHTMETVYPLRVPLLCDVEAGPDWGHVKEWEG
jgi:DNA polymerase-1